MILPTPISVLVGFTVLTLILALLQMVKNDRDLKRHKREMEHKVYETMILQEIGDRVGFERDVAKILDAIIGSLSKLVSFSATGYMLISSDGASVRSKIVLAEPVLGKYVEVLKEHLRQEFGKVVPNNFPTEAFSNEVVGDISGRESDIRMASLWIVPVTLAGRALGVLAVSSRTAGLYRGPEMEVLLRILGQAEKAVLNLEKVIASEEHKLNEMVASIADGVVMLDPELGLVVVNAAATRLLGLPGKDGATFMDVVKVLADKLDVHAKIEEARSSAQVLTVDNLFIGERVSQLLVSPVFDRDRKFLGTVLLFHDMTAQKQLERMRDEFMAMMVHELRAPLTVVRGTTDMLTKNPQLLAEQQGKDLLKTMESSAVGMLTLVNDLLDVAKIEAGKFQVAPTQGDLVEVISDRVKFFQEMAVEKAIGLALGTMESPLVTMFDRDRIIQVLNNLVANAIKFTAAGGKVTVSAQKIDSEGRIPWRYFVQPRVKVAGPVVLVSVSDTGQGISEEQLPLLFSKFKQLVPSMQDHTGTGLGLVIAKGIVESHGGQIFAESEVNKGSTFYFTIPVRLNSTEPKSAGATGDA